LITLGVDPGLSGALALVNWRERWAAITDIPTFEVTRGDGKRKSRELDLAGLADLLDEWPRPDLAVVEGVWAMAGDNVTSLAALMESAGVLVGMVASRRIPLHRPIPTVWKRAFRLPMGKTIADRVRKDASRRKASQLMPWASLHWRRVQDHGRAEAALLAFYGQRFVQIGDPFA
jgi:crossover junction endodeoxyribonuclease RuvC